MERLAMFVDGSNMYHAQKALGWFIDYARLLAYFSRGRALYNAFYYAAKRELSDQRDERFYRYLTLSGYTVRLKPIKKIFDYATGETVYKGNLDMEIGVDMFVTLDLYDTCLLFSGDSDFERPFELLRSKGKKVVCASIPSQVAVELRNAADSFIDLTPLRDRIGRTDRVPMPAGANEDFYHAAFDLSYAAQNGSHPNDTPAVAERLSDGGNGASESAARYQSESAARSQTDGARDDQPAESVEPRTGADAAE